MKKKLLAKPRTIYGEQFRSAPPRPHSTYHVLCECGQEAVSQARVTVCPHCGRILVFEWGRDAVEVTESKTSEKAKTMGAGA